MKPSDLSIFNALNDSEAAILTIWGEARGEPFEGKQAVGVVIANRAEKQKKTIKEIVYAIDQFSCFLSADPNYPYLVEIAKNFDLAYGNKPILRECAQAWRGQDAVATLLDGATFYRVTGTVNNWFDKEVAEGKLVKTAEIGRQEFFKEI